MMGTRSALLAAGLLIAAPAVAAPPVMGTMSGFLPAQPW
jgi:hypothetical protein